MQWHRLVDDAPLLTRHGIGTYVLFSDIVTLDYRTVTLDAKHCTATTFVASGEHDDLVAFFDLVPVRLLSHLWPQRHDLHKLFGSQLTCYGPENTCTNGL